MTAGHYALVRSVHVGCVALSGALFLSRGVMSVAGSGLARHAVLRRLSFGIDTLLLVAALTLAAAIRQWPFVQAWLTAKVLLLVVYVGLGVFALRLGRTPAIRAACLVGALSVYALIVSIAITHDPRGFLR